MARRGRKPAWLRLAAGVVIAVAFTTGFAAAGLIAGLDHTVRSRFEGVRFRVPSRVYGAPTILYPGLDWRRTSTQSRGLAADEARSSPRTLATTRRVSVRYLLREPLRWRSGSLRPNPPTARYLRKRNNHGARA